jgi:hypothetical protein
MVDTLGLVNIAPVLPLQPSPPYFVALTSLTLTGNHIELVSDYLMLGGTSLKTLIVEHTFLLLGDVGFYDDDLWSSLGEFVYTDSPGPRSTLTNLSSTARLPATCSLDDDFYNCPVRGVFARCTNVSTCTSSTLIVTSTDDWNNTRINEYACASDARPFVYASCAARGSCQWACYLYNCSDYDVTVSMNITSRENCFQMLGRADDISFGESAMSYEPYSGPYAPSISPSSFVIDLG